MSSLEAALEHSLALSRFARRHSGLVDTLRAAGALMTPRPLNALVEQARALCDTHGVMAGLRIFRNLELLRTLACDLNGASLEEVTTGITHVAVAATRTALNADLAAHVEEYGEPMLSDGAPCPFVVLGMGKLGAGELNYSSDIDVVYLYASDDGAAGDGTTLHQLYSAVARSLSQTLGKPTADGLVFRVDVDLRPDGRNGPLVNSIASARTYYESFGQTWERFAMFKARPIAGDLELGDGFLEIIRPFVYRRTLDFSTLETIRAMKRRIDQHRARQAHGRNVAAGYDVKLGRGGIREIEFIVQTLTLLNAGRFPSVRERNTLRALTALAEAGLLPESDARELGTAYRTLRTLEHRVQTIELAQTHELPTDEEEAERILGISGVTADELHQMCDLVAARFDELFATPADEPAESAEAALFYDAQLSDEHEAQLMDSLAKRLDLTEPSSTRRSLEKIRRLPAGPNAERGARYLQRMAPAIFAELDHTADPDAAIRNLESFLSRIGAWITLLALLAEKPETTRTLVRLFGTSEYLSALFIAHPELLDELVRFGSAYVYMSRGQLRRALQERLRESDHFEDRLDAMRRWRHAQHLRIGLADVSGALDIVDVNRQLAQVADACVRASLEASWAELAGAEPSTPEGFLVVGLGSLGGRELAFGSDLDLVFFYDPERFSHPTLSPQEAATKLGQRVITALSAPTREGFAFRVDMRLRPSGTSGPLVTTPEAFARYHEAGAQLWEILAWVRARAVVGDAQIWRRLRPFIDTLTQPHATHSPAEIAREVANMRARLEKEIAREKGAKYNLKTGFGGLVDIEFTVQFLQIATSEGRIPRTPNTLSALKRLAGAKTLARKDADELEQAYRFLRRLENRLRIASDRAENALPRDPRMAGRVARRMGLAGEGNVEAAGRDLLARYERHTQSVRDVFTRMVKDSVGSESEQKQE